MKTLRSMFLTGALMLPVFSAPGYAQDLFVPYVPLQVVVPPQPMYVAPQQPLNFSVPQPQPVFQPHVQQVATTPQPIYIAPPQQQLRVVVPPQQYVPPITSQSIESKPIGMQLPLYQYQNPATDPYGDALKRIREQERADALRDESHRMMRREWKEDMYRMNKERNEQQRRARERSREIQERMDARTEQIRQERLAQKERERRSYEVDRIVWAIRRSNIPYCQKMDIQRGYGWCAGRTLTQ